MRADLSTEWLTAQLHAPVSAFQAERIGTGQMSECHRVVLEYHGDASGPASVVLKVAASDPVSRQTGVALGLYGPIAPCYHASFEQQSGTFAVLLGDAGPERARLAVSELGRMHGPVIEDPTLAGAAWLKREAPISQALLAPRHRDVCERLVASFDAYLAADEQAGARQGLVHGDYRLDNMLFGLTGADRPLTVVDWQTVSWGPAMTDLAYFLGCALPVPVRRAHADELMACYHQALRPTMKVTLDDVREGVRRQTFAGVVMTIVSPMLVQRTDRGDEMFMAMLERHCEQVLDTDALALLPKSVAAQPLRPTSSDEFAHQAAAEPMWNESWYCDEGVAWFTALLCGPDQPTVALFDFTHRVVSELHTYRVHVRGRGEALDDPAALLRGEPGREVDLTMDLAWSTPRYEIPCTVTGDVNVDGRRMSFWWAMDWVWSALHLDDGTHLHAVDIRLPGAPPIGVGYIQSPTAALTELNAVAARASFGDNGLPVATAITIDPGALESIADIQGHAPLRLEAPDGRVSWFARAWATVATSDGREGVGWIEWNRSQTG